jgi:hypothetical protein
MKNSAPSSELARFQVSRKRRRELNSAILFGGTLKPEPKRAGSRNQPATIGAFSKEAASALRNKNRIKQRRCVTWVFLGGILSLCAVFQRTRNGGAGGGRE